MFVAEISWQIPATSTAEQLDEISYSLLAALHKNGQIINFDYPIAIDRKLSPKIEGLNSLSEKTVVSTIRLRSLQAVNCQLSTINCLRTFVSILKPDSLDLQYANKYVRIEIAKAIELGFSAPQIQLIGAAPDISEGKACNCQSSSYVLYTHYLEIGSPIKCGDCFGHVPLYLLPKTYDGDEYYDIYIWDRDYRACDTLQMHGTGERFGIRQMSDLRSNLAKQGREICDKLTQLTGKPVYYYLYRYKVKTTIVKEKQRRCPGCNGDWLISQQWHRFDFKCNACRLVSNLACTVT